MNMSMINDGTNAFPYPDGDIDVDALASRAWKRRPGTQPAMPLRPEA